METETETRKFVAPVQKKRLHEGKLNIATQVRRHLFAYLPVGTVEADILNPDFWAHVSAQVQPLDIVETICEDGSWEGLYRVMYVSKGDVRLHRLYMVAHKTLVEAVSGPGYDIAWKGPVAKWAIIKADTKEIVKGGFFPKDAAAEALKDLLKNLKE